MTDERMQQVIGRLLRGGVLLAAAVVLAGGVWLLTEHGSSTPQYRQFRGEPAELRSAGGLASAGMRPEVIVQIGLMLLIGTPVARVVFSLAAFALERDGMYVVITMIVLGVLVYSLAVPHG